MMPSLRTCERLDLAVPCEAQRRKSAPERPAGASAVQTEPGSEPGAGPAAAPALASAHGSGSGGSSSSASHVWADSLMMAEACGVLLWSGDTERCGGWGPAAAAEAVRNLAQAGEAARAIYPGKEGRTG